MPEQELNYRLDCMRRYAELALSEASRAKLAHWFDRLETKESAIEDYESA